MMRTCWENDGNMVISCGYHVKILGNMWEITRICVKSWRCTGKILGYAWEKNGDIMEI